MGAGTGTATAGAQPFRTHQPAFAAVLGPDPLLVEVDRVAAHEGPVWFADEQALYYTTTPAWSGGDGPEVRIERLRIDGLTSLGREIVLARADGANGMCASRGGTLLVCEQGGRGTPARISRLHRDTGARETVVDSLRGLPLSSPNDVAEHPDGSIWFTDPSYGFLQHFRPRPALGDAVYRYDPETSALRAVADDLDKPNGLAFSADGSVLYVGDSGANHELGSYDPARPHHIRAYDVAGGSLRNGRLLSVVTPGFPDGVATDPAGHVYASCATGVLVHDSEGLLLGEIALPGAVSFCLGGRDGHTLLITTDDAIWAARLGPGVLIPKAAP